MENGKWARLGSCKRPLGSLFASPGGILGTLGAILGALGGVLGASWERLMRLLGVFWNHLGRFLALKILEATILNNEKPSKALRNRASEDKKSSMISAKINLESAFKAKKLLRWL